MGRRKAYYNKGGFGKVTAIASSNNQGSISITGTTDYVVHVETT